MLGRCRYLQAGFFSSSFLPSEIKSDGEQLDKYDDRKVIKATDKGLRNLARFLFSDISSCEEGQISYREEIIKFWLFDT